MLVSKYRILDNLGLEFSTYKNRLLSKMPATDTLSENHIGKYLRTGSLFNGTRKFFTKRVSDI